MRKLLHLHASIDDLFFPQMIIMACVEYRSIGFQVQLTSYDKRQQSYSRHRRCASIIQGLQQVVCKHQAFDGIGTWSRNTRVMVQ